MDHRNLTDDEFNKTDDRKLLGYFRQDLLETRFLSKGRRIDLILELQGIVIIIRDNGL